MLGSNQNCSNRGITSYETNLQKKLFILIYQLNFSLKLNYNIMKKLIFTLFVIVLFNLGYSQTGWILQNPIPQGNMLLNVKFLNDNTGYMVGQNVILKTTNGGQSVIFQNPPVNGEFNSVWFCDANNGFIAGGSIGGSTYDGLILKTTNGGNIWNTLVSGIISLWGIYFFDANTGFVSGGNGNILKTTNGGQNWIAQNSNTTIALWTITFINNQTGFVVGGSFNPGQIDNPGDGLILKTTNGGTNWFTILSAQPNTFFGIQFPNSSTGFVSGINGTLLKSIDGGNNWSILNSGTSAFLFGLFATDASTITACGGTMSGSGGTIIRSINGGMNWNNCLNPSDTNSFLLSVGYSSANTGFAVGIGGKTLKTINGGVNWTSLSSSATTNDINCIFFRNDFGFGVTDKGDIINTTNGGNNWSIKSSYWNYDFNAVYFLDNNTGFVCGSDNIDKSIVMKTINGGSSWSIKYLSSNGNSSFKSICFLDNSIGYVFGYNWGSDMLKTTDGGNTWTSFNSPTNVSIYASSFLNSNTGYIAGWGGTVAKTTDGGGYWSVFQQIINNNLNTIFAIDQNTVYAAGDSNVVIKSVNGGLNWTYYSFSSYSGAKFRSIYFPNSNTGYLVGNNNFNSGLIFATTNAGYTWTSQNIGTSNNLNSVFFISASTGYVAGDNGAIFKTTTGGSIWVGKISSEVPDKFKLYQNYPNPFNPSTNIKFQIKESKQVTLKIFDILGKEIATLINEKLQPGAYETSFDGSNLASGVYFYRLIAGNFTETKKMLIVK